MHVMIYFDTIALVSKNSCYWYQITLFQGQTLKMHMEENARARVRWACIIMPIAKGGLKILDPHHISRTSTQKTCTRLGPLEVAIKQRVQVHSNCEEWGLALAGLLQQQNSGKRADLFGKPSFPLGPPCSKTKSSFNLTPSQPDNLSVATDSSTTNRGSNGGWKSFQGFYCVFKRDFLISGCCTSVGWEIGLKKVGLEMCWTDAADIPFFCRALWASH